MVFFKLFLNKRGNNYSSKYDENFANGYIFFITNGYIFEILKKIGILKWVYKYTHFCKWYIYNQQMEINIPKKPMSSGR